VPLSLGVLQERRRVRDPRVGEHDVEPAEFFDHAVDEGLHLGGVAHIQADRDRLAPAPADLLRHCLGGLDLDVAERDGRALLGKGERGRAPDPERASGDCRDPTRQAHRPDHNASRGGRASQKHVAPTAQKPTAIRKAIR
jgi:hypothetical protein